MPDLFTNSAATFSPCGRYRYTLKRTWNPEGPTVNFLMLNPSTADEVQNDPTVERCERRARAWNYGNLAVTNLFAWRSTDPGVLAHIDDPIGPDNDAAIVETAHDSHLIICAWGKDGTIRGRGEAVRKRLSIFAVLYYLRLSAVTGQPCHPLYLPYSLKPTVWSLS